MSAEFIQLHAATPDRHKIRQIAYQLKEGSIAIVPTDTVYALACDMHNKTGIEQICKILGKKPAKANLSLLCSDLSDLSEYCRQIPNPVFKLMKRVLPGPYTFILNANNSISKIFRTNKKTVGIRVPRNQIIADLIGHLGNPIVSSSIHSEDEVLDYLTEPEQIYDLFQHAVQIVVDGGAGGNVPSTVLDCTGQEPIIVREGKGVEAL